MEIILSSPWKQINMSPISLEGQMLGKYHILQPLGRGGMAQVYKAYHPQLDRYVAIKVLRPDLVEESEFLTRFRHEARAIAALRHPNIVQVYDFDAQDDLYYMVMELLEGNTLKAHLNAFRTRGERLPPGELVRILCDVLDGLAYAHGEGIIHRDLKPANILLTQKGQAVLTDFGIAQIIGTTQYTVSGVLMGTLNYMAPEQGLHGRCDERSDIYALGIVYYEMLTGTVPFEADTPLATLMKHLNDPLLLPHKLDQEIPIALEEVVIKALAKSPEDRYQSANEMKEAVLNAAQAAGIELPKVVNLPGIASPSAGRGGTVAVFSGSARQNIPDDNFASGDTDIRLGQKLGQRTPGFLGVFRSVENILASWVTPKNVTPKKAGPAVLYAVGWMVLVNMALLWASGVFGWKVFGKAWPVELIAAGTLLAALMAALANPWLFIPAGITIGLGFMFTYYALTGWWRHWIVFWPLVPILVGVCIVAAVLLSRQGRQGQWLSRYLGILMVAVSVVAFLPILALSILLP